MIIRKVPSFIPRLAAFATATLLSACGIGNALHTNDVYTDLKDADVIRGPATDPAAVDMRTGMATYTGLGVVGASDGRNGTLFLGDSTIVMNFDTAEASGQIAMYSAKDGFDPNVDADNYLSNLKADPKGFILSMGPTSGLVTFSNGSVADGAFSVDASSGALTYNGSTVLVTGGTVTGKFTGENANGVRTTDSDLIGTINGVTAEQLIIYFAAAE